MESCCAVPEDMSEFCNNNNIKIKTHKDDEIPINQAKLDKILKENESDRVNPNGTMIKPVWVLMYQLMDSGRGVILEKRILVGLEQISVE